MGKRIMKKVKIGEREFEIPLDERIFLYEEIIVDIGRVWSFEEKKYVNDFIKQSVIFAEFPDGKWRKITNPIEYVAWVNLMKMIDDIKYFKKKNHNASIMENCVMIVKRLFPDCNDNAVLVMFGDLCGD